MDSAAARRHLAALRAIDAVLSERIVQRRGPGVLAQLTRRLRHMNRPAGHEAAVRRLGADRALLLRVKAAMGRLSGARYGVCLLCHKPISAPHLNAVPWAAFCIPCRAAMDSREAVLASPGVRGWTRSNGFGENGAP